jgi:hypothetical protein
VGGGGVLEAEHQAILRNQCCGYMTFWCGSGSADPCPWHLDRIRIRFLLFSSFSFKRLTKN